MNGKEALLRRVERLSPREVWVHEANDFTPWLAKVENMAMLAETLHLGAVEVEATEMDVGRFSADIVGRDEEGNLVLIENQIEATDHRHLGQILTYLAGLPGAATIIWIAKEFLEEHRAAIDWLNANTVEQFSFFGVEIELLRIGAEMAPNFNVVAKPNDWSRRVGFAVRQIGETPINDLQRLYLDYWTAFREVLISSGETRLANPWPRAWWPLAIGRSGFSLNTSLLRDQRRIMVELWISPKGGSAKQAFRDLEADKVQIEAQFGQALSWQELPTRKGSRIALYRDIPDIIDRANWPEQHRWLADRLRDFRRAFAVRIKSLKLFLEETDASAVDIDILARDT